MTTIQTLEHNEHAQHAAEHGGKRAALLIAVLAALLATGEVQAKHAEIFVDEDSAPRRTVGASIRRNRSGKPWRAIWNVWQ